MQFDVHEDALLQVVGQLPHLLHVVERGLQHVRVDREHLHHSEMRMVDSEMIAHCGKDEGGVPGPGFCLVGGGGQGGFLVRSLVDGAGSYSVAHRAGLLPTELTGMWGWILLRSPHQGRGSPRAPAPTKQRPDPDDLGLQQTVGDVPSLQAYPVQLAGASLDTLTTRTAARNEEESRQTRTERVLKEAA